MTPPPTELYRKASLERLASPERLDQLMVVVRPRHWVPLAVLGGVILLATGWAALGRLPIAVIGRGAFVEPGSALGADAHVVGLEAPGAGVLLRLDVRRGDHLAPGQVIGHIDQPELAARLRDERARLDELLGQAQALSGVEAAKGALNRQAIANSRTSLKRSLANARAITPVLRDRSLAALKAERQALAARLTQAPQLITSLERKLATDQALRDKALVSEPVLIEAKRQVQDAIDQQGRLRTQLREVDTRETEVERAYQANQDQIAGLESQLAALDVQARGKQLEDLQSHTVRTSAIAESRRRITQLEASLAQQSEIHAKRAGRVLDVSAAVGQLVTVGQRLASLEQDGGAADDAPLVAVGYFSIGDGKRIRPGMQVQLTPDTVKREEYGGVVGEVTRVSAFPVSHSGVVNVVNDDDVAHALTADGHTIEVLVKLARDPDSASGYRWSGSKGPPQKLSAGTTQTMRVTVDERAPLSYLLPILRANSGL